MSHWVTPQHLEKKLATRAERKAFTRVHASLRTCTVCGGLFGRPADRDACEAWHREFFLNLRRDLQNGIGRLHARLESDSFTKRSQRREVEMQLRRLQNLLSDVVSYL